MKSKMMKAAIALMATSLTLGIAGCAQKTVEEAPKDGTTQEEKINAKNDKRSHLRIDLGEESYDVEVKGLWCASEGESFLAGTEMVDGVIPINIMGDYVKNFRILIPENRWVVGELTDDLRDGVKFRNTEATVEGTDLVGTVKGVLKCPLEVPSGD